MPRHNPSTKRDALAILDRAYEATGFRPTVIDARRHGYSGGNRHFYYLQSEWLKAKKANGEQVKVRLRGTKRGQAFSSNHNEIYIPSNLWQLAEAVKMETMPPLDPQPARLSVSQECVELYQEAWGGIVGGRVR